MQPILAVTAPSEGMVSINGRFAGEAGPDRPLLVPVAAFGAVYLEFSPLRGQLLPMARRFVFSGGAPLPESFAQAQGLSAVCWPCGVTEIDCTPQRVLPEAAAEVALDGRAFRLVRGAETRLESDGVSHCLPEGAGLPELVRGSGWAALTGDADDGQYLLLLTPDLRRRIGLLQADRIVVGQDGVLEATALSHDFVGHGMLEHYRADGTGLSLLSSEGIWEQGVPRRPSCPEEAARAAVEAALLKRFDEAGSYFAPALSARMPPAALAGLCDLCLPMKYALPTGEPCTGLLRMEAENLARVAPLYFRAEQIRGEWLLTALEADGLP